MNWTYLLHPLIVTIGIYNSWKWKTKMYVTISKIVKILWMKYMFCWISKLDHAHLLWSKTFAITKPHTTRTKSNLVRLILSQPSCIWSLITSEKQLIQNCLHSIFTLAPLHLKGTYNQWQSGKYLINQWEIWPIYKYSFLLFTPFTSLSLSLVLPFLSIDSSLSFHFN